MSADDTTKTFYALSIDGGGMRGIYATRYLAGLTESISRKHNMKSQDIGKAFKLIAGTSTGGIIACALAIGIPPKQILDLYRNHGPAIFPRKVPGSVGIELAWQLYRRPYYLKQGTQALTNAVEEIFGDWTLGKVWTERKIALAVPATEVSRNHSWVFKTPHMPGTNHRDDDYRLSDVCLATSAAPIYRSMARVAKPNDESFNVFIDGGLWANNPVLVALTDALGMTKEGDRIEIFCLGSCARPEGELVNETEAHRGLGGWKFGGVAASASITAQEYAFDNMARMLSKHVRRDCQITRFPQGRTAASMNKFLDLDETSPKGMEALRLQADKDISETMSICGDSENPLGISINRLCKHIAMSTV